jgi:hypothetical protein
VAAAVAVVLILGVIALAVHVLLAHHVAGIVK